MLEIAGGIILAVLFFYFLPLIFAGGVALLALVIAIGLIALVFSQFTAVLGFIAMVACTLAVVGIPAHALEVARKRYPALDAAIKGAPPYNGSRRFPVRFLITLLVVVGLIAIGGVILASILFVASLFGFK